ncbi:hypothetical protein [Sphingopyxis sp. R3-92]|uniref:hypothetical protein n=1 Tax=Sphingopyxis sp. R3-92 TaxID=3158553 RepID=UPI003EE5313A
MHPTAMFRDQEKLDGLYDRAVRIMDGLAPGFCQPIFRALAVRNYSNGQALLACNFLKDKGPCTHPAFAAYWYRKAWRNRSALAAQHMAMNCFASNDLQGYRRWLRRAARLGYDDEAFELGKFATRLPHRRLRAIGRLRPAYKRNRKQGRDSDIW